MKPEPDQEQFAPGGLKADALSAAGGKRASFSVFGAPLWLVALLILLFYWAQSYLVRNSGGFHALVHQPGESIADVQARVPRAGPAIFMAKGRRVYGVYCGACHQASGLGTPGLFPPLTGSEWVLAPGPDRLINIVLNGVQGPMSVKGVEYNNIMLPWRDQLSDDEIAAVLTFVRRNRSWGHNASEVLSTRVAAIRGATVARGAAAWTADELLALPDKGPE